MSIPIVCQCGTAFQAPPQLAGQTVPCPGCQLPLTVPAAPSTLGTHDEPFTAQLATPAPHPLQTPAKPAPNNRLILWLAIGGGGLALLVFLCAGIGLLAVVGRATRQAASSAAPTAPINTEPINTAGPTSTAAGAKAPPSEEESQQFAQQLEQAINSGDGQALTNAVDWEALLRSAVDGVDAPPKFREGFLQGARKTAATSLSSSMMPAVQQGARLRLLRVRDQQGQTRALFRFLHADGGLNYLEFVLAKQPDGRVRAVDIFIFASGELTSESLRRMYLLALRSQPGSPGASGGVTQQTLMQDLEKLKQLTAALQNGDQQQVLRIYDSLPAAAKREKFALVAALQATAAVDFQRHIQIAEEYRALFPNDASLDLMMLDSLVLKKQHAEALQAVDRLDKALGGDPYLNVTRASIVMEQDPAAAQQYAEQAIDTEPTLQLAYWTMVTSSIQQRDFDATARWLTTIRDKFQVDIGDLSTVPEYAEFVQSQQYRDWLAME